VYILPKMHVKSFSLWQLDVLDKFCPLITRLRPAVAGLRRDEKLRPYALGSGATSRRGRWPMTRMQE
jgi:hypothetical protein